MPAPAESDRIPSPAFVSAPGTCGVASSREGTERVRIKGKAWVRFDDGTDAIVGGSRVER